MSKELQNPFACNADQHFDTNLKCPTELSGPHNFPLYGAKLQSNARGIHTEFCKADRTTWKLTLQVINTTPKEPKTERGRSRRQLFRHFCCSSVRRNEQRRSALKFPQHSQFRIPDTELKHSQNHSISRVRERARAQVSCLWCLGWTKTNLRNMGKTMQKMNSISDL